MNVLLDEHIGEVGLLEEVQLLVQDVVLLQVLNQLLKSLVVHHLMLVLKDYKRLDEPQKGDLVALVELFLRPSHLHSQVHYHVFEVLHEALIILGYRGEDVGYLRQQLEAYLCPGPLLDLLRIKETVELHPKDRKLVLRRVYLADCLSQLHHLPQIKSHIELGYLVGDVEWDHESLFVYHELEILGYELFKDLVVLLVLSKEQAVRPE